jgi:WD40 repeat protein
VPRDTFAVALTPDGRRIATTDPTSTAVRIWDTERRQLLMLLLDDDHHSGGIAFTPDGRLIVGRASGGLTIWETQKPACSFCPTGLAP